MVAVNDTYGADSFAYRQLREAIFVLSKKDCTFTSLHEFESSSYYPFQSSLSPTCHSGSLTINLRANVRYYTVNVKLSGLPVNYEGWDSSVRLPFDSKQTTTAKALWYMRPINLQMEELEEIRTNLRSIKAVYEKYECPMALKLKPPPIKPSFEKLPTTAKQLTEYIGWLQRIEGVTSLTDGWNHRLQFTLLNRRLVCHSAGPDGVFNNRDDIIVQAPSS